MSVVSKYGPPFVLGAGLVVLGTAIVSMARQGFDTPGDLESLLRRAAKVSTIDMDLVPFGLAVARRESRFNPQAANTDASEADLACDLYHASQALYANNPYGADAFCWGSGGYFGFLPATGMKPKVFRNLDPRRLIFDPKASVAMLADYVYRIVSGYFGNLPADERNWLSIRRSQASLTTMFNPGGQRARDVEARLGEDLSAVGADPDLMYDRVSIRDYPGAAAVWSAA